VENTFFMLVVKFVLITQSTEQSMLLPTFKEKQLL